VDTLLKRVLRCQRQDTFDGARRYLAGRVSYVANLFFRGHVYIMVTFVTHKDINGRFVYLPGPILSIVHEDTSAGKGNPSSNGYIGVISA
jgi:hypothetical protein